MCDVAALCEEIILPVYVELPPRIMGMYLQLRHTEITQIFEIFLVGPLRKILPIP